ncbi:hypothetical protein EV361DRAFT_421284 [Lentinula raphanica]|uniref:Secreted protein n=1 Tax=Lentinula raphanica TaxID=153919 RepID=A0AA38PKB2_9AGAR|nr:hypothetical protein F5878DRAFT_94916 [Lentinula raphanica]KAJ3968390.1 hypothetical protein EV361DRAFT_421284 [Lentinula raphanica]
MRLNISSVLHVFLCSSIVFRTVCGSPLTPSATTPSRDTSDTESPPNQPQLPTGPQLSIVFIVRLTSGTTVRPVEGMTPFLKNYIKSGLEYCASQLRYDHISVVFHNAGGFINPMSRTVYRNDIQELIYTFDFITYPIQYEGQGSLTIRFHTSRHATTANRSRTKMSLHLQRTGYPAIDVEIGPQSSLQFSDPNPRRYSEVGRVVEVNNGNARHDHRERDGESGNPRESGR